VYPLPDAEAVAQIMKAEMAKIGIKINIKEDANWLTMYYGPRNKIGITNLTYGNGTDPTYHYSLMLDSSDAKLNGSNSADYHNPKVDAALRRATQAQTPLAEYKALKAVADLSQPDVPYLVLYAQQDGLIVSKKYKMRNFTDFWQARNWALDILPAS
jgi:peptide/nickel transport system substrate-binding protein